MAAVAEEQVRVPERAAASSLQPGYRTRLPTKRVTPKGLLALAPARSGPPPRLVPRLLGLQPPAVARYSQVQATSIQPPCTRSPLPAVPHSRPLIAGSCVSHRPL